MRQLVQRPNGDVVLIDVPTPALRKGGVLVRTSHSVVSPGTERQRLSLARKSLLAKAHARPDLVRQVILRAKQDGVLATYRRVQHRLSNPVVVGYSSSGVIIAVADDIGDLKVGDVVACAGAGFANHAEVAFVPRNLCVRVPAGLPSTHAAFGTLGAIAIQGVRQAELAVGETVAIIGLGLIGLLAVLVAKAAGCYVVGVDPIQAKRELALTIGADMVAAGDDDASGAVGALSGAIGADAVLVCASTIRNDPLRLSGRLARDRGRVVVIGLVGMEVPRQLYYDKELTLRMSRSYGPGRYDHLYEIGGHDYPIGYVRWTEQRNVESFLRLATRNPTILDRLISIRFPFERAPEAYELLRRDPRAVGILLDYPESVAAVQRDRIEVAAAKLVRDGTVRLGLIGAGVFAQGVLLPLLEKRRGTSLDAVAATSGTTAKTVADRYGCRYATSDYRQILEDPEIDAVLICTRHDTHATILTEAVRHGKDAFVEKPLAISSAELDRLAAATQSGNARFMVGFNRRYSPMLTAARDFLADAHGPLLMIYRINAGTLSPGHWLADDKQGGRILGEVCHFVDSLQYVAGSRPTRVFASGPPGKRSVEDVSVTIDFANGAVGSIVYAAGGDMNSGKERFEAFGGGKTAIIEDFKRCELYSPRRRKRWSTRSPDKGHGRELDAFLGMLHGAPPQSLPIDSVVATRATLAIRESLRLAQPVCL